MNNRGWHPDPEGSGGVRYWDGERWGEVRGAPQAAPPAAPPPVPDWQRQAWPQSGWPPAPTPRPMPWAPIRPVPVDLAAGRTKAKICRAALAIAVPIQALATVAGGVVAKASVVAFRVTYRQIEANPNGPTPKVAVNPDPGAVAVSQLTSIAVLAIGIAFLLWFHSVAVRARALGLPARRSPGWGVAGFLIPVVNFWFPYGSMKDVLPPGHPKARLVGPWFGLWLGSNIALGLAQLALAFSTPIGLVVLVPAVGVLIAAALTARRLVAAVEEAHAEVVERARS